MDNIRIILDQWNEYRSKFGVLACELDGKGREDEPEVAPVLVISRAEKGGAETSVCKGPLRNGLRDRGLSCSSEPVQPIDRGLFEGVCPDFDLVQNNTTGSLKTTVTIAVSKLSLPRIVETVEDDRFGYGGDRIR